MHADLRGKTALITGAGKRTGIGYAIATTLARNGVNVILTDIVVQTEDAANPPIGSVRDEMLLLAENLARQFKIKALFVALDVTRNLSVNQMLDAVTAEFDHLQILCNNAGAVFGVPSAIHTYDEDAWIRTIDLNLHGVFRVSKALVPVMMNTGGSIINIASRAAKVPPLFNGAYAVSKAGVVMLTKVMAKELAGSGIRVNAVCPGVITTGFTKWRFGLEAKVLNSTEKEREAEMIKTIPLGRLGSSEEVANLVAFLASSQSSYMTGQAINITGGQLMEL